MQDVAYAVHTSACTFLLDAAGVCRWIVSRTGMVPPEIRGCVGAQFVACMHPELDGGLAGELVLGAVALFVKDEPQDDRKVLLRTGTIVHVEQRGATRASFADRLSDDTLDLADGPPLSTPPRTGARGGDTIPPPEALEPTPNEREGTVTLTLPLYRPEAQVLRVPIRGRR